MATNIPNELIFSKEHEWLKQADDHVIIGITDFAQSALGDIVFIELPEVGKTLEKDGTFGVVESIKSVSDLYSPIDGEVIEVNEALVDSPEAINAGPYDSWIVKIRPSKPDQISALLSPKDYQELCEQQE